MLWFPSVQNGSAHKYGDPDYWKVDQFGQALLALFPADFLLMLARFFDGLISFVVLGVLLETLLEGRQYCFFLVLAPQGFPVRVSIHFSAAHRLREDPFFDFLTCPFPFRHLAIA